MDTGVQRGAEANSDYYLKTCIKSCLSTHKKKKRVKLRLAVERLKDEKTRKAFSDAVTKKTWNNFGDNRRRLVHYQQKQCWVSGKE